MHTIAMPATRRRMKKERHAGIAASAVFNRPLPYGGRSPTQRRTAQHDRAQRTEDVTSSRRWLHSRGILCKFIRSGITQKTARCRRAGERPDGAPYTYEVARSMSSNFRSGKSHGSEPWMDPNRQAALGSTVSRAQMTVEIPSVSLVDCGSTDLPHPSQAGPPRWALE